ncbi:hypothetical protein Leryth_023557 [Lithospermum erythrorhizon]|nr:hypothetical protein Leryth_023557 [Lithospermum erythrorhizon]
MAKGAVISALCILACATIAYSEVFDVKGHVYCDPCKFGFTNALQRGLQGATVELTCSNIVNKTVTFTHKATTDVDGAYTITVKHDHQDDVCEVKTISSGSAECTLPITASARIECTENSGIHSAVRLANPLGFMNEKPIAGCKKVLEDLELGEAELSTLDLSPEDLAKLQ